MIAVLFSLVLIVQFFEKVAGARREVLVTCEVPKTARLLHPKSSASLASTLRFSLSQYAAHLARSDHRAGTAMPGCRLHYYQFYIHYYEYRLFDVISVDYVYILLVVAQKGKNV